MAWAEVKGMTTDEKIAALEKAGFKRWTKGNYDRLYINAGALGLVCTYHKTGSIKDAYFCGDEISNSQAYRMKASKTFIDIKDWKLYSDNDRMEEAAQKIIDKAIAA